jgi:cysteinyl-tRNA synthetase
MLKIFNTLTRKKEEFVPLEPGRVKMYVCGINPYDYCHIGHARSYIVFDVIRRYLELLGYEVKHIQNFTDIEDNILQRARESGVDWREMVERFVQAYFEDMDALGILRAHAYPRPTEHMADIIELVQRLVEQGVGYAVNGDVCLSVRQVSGYGKLSGRSLDDMLAGARVEVDERKKDPLDFALWKAAKPGEPTWESPWGPGRPGWHVECSAMSMRYLGEQVDIHGGGQDLIFPHHENEIAQSEAATGKPFVRCWIHNGWVTVQGQKMSKSLGNFVTVRDALKRWSPAVTRFFILSTHYRSPIDFGPEALEHASRGVERLEITCHHLNRLLAVPEQEPPLSPLGRGGPGSAQGPSSADDLAGLEDAAAVAEQAFRDAMDDDFNTPRALGAIFDFVGEIHRLTGAADFRPSAKARQVLQQARDTLERLTDCLGLRLGEKAEPSELSGGLVEILIHVRQRLRELKLFDLADEIRARLRSLGIALEDHPEGTTWRRL